MLAHLIIHLCQQGLPVQSFDIPRRLADPRILVPNCASLSTEVLRSAVTTVLGNEAKTPWTSLTSFRDVDGSSNEWNCCPSKTSVRMR